MAKQNPTPTSYLLDTHVFLWMAERPSKLSKTAAQILENSANTLYLSPITAFEIKNKFRIGKLDEYSFVAENYLEVMQKLQLTELPLSTRAAHFAGQFEWAHRDPFDRILAASAFVEDLPLISADAVFRTLHWLDTVW
jgi:PIN domain nuclease of toxin-antitoxin system